MRVRIVHLGTIYNVNRISFERLVNNLSVGFLFVKFKADP